MSAIRTRRRPTIAQDWQLAVLKKLHSESENPTDEQRRAAVAETGLDDKWIRSWFTRQRSRSRKGQPSTTSSPIVSTFRLRLYYPSSANGKATTPPSNDPPASTPTTRIPTYSRDPLCDRYPDFSQFFRPRGPQRPCTFELSTPRRDPFTQLTDVHTPMHLQGLFDGDDPCLPSCPVAFSMKLVDLLRCS